MQRRSVTDSLLLVALALTGLTVLALVGYCVSQRLFYLHGLSRLEGAFVEHTLRVARGDPLYGPPSAQFVSMIYTPVSYFVGAWFVRAGADGFVAGRVASLIGIAGAVLVAWALAYRVTQSVWLSSLTPVLAAVGYFHTDAYYDQARPDNVLALFYLLVVAGLMLESVPWAVGLTATAGMAAIYTKQSSVVLLAPLLGLFLLIRPRVAILSGLVLTVLSVGIFVWANATTGGWFFIHALETPTHHGLTLRGLCTSLSEDLTAGFAVQTLAAVLTATWMCARGQGWIRYRLSQPRFRALLTVLAATLAAAAYSVVSKANQGAVNNVLVVYALTTAAFLPALAGWALREMPAERRGLARHIALVVLLFVTVGGVHDPAAFLPTQRHERRWARFRERMAAYGPPERLWVPSFGAALGSGSSDPLHPSMAAIKDYVGGYFGRQTGRAFPPAILRLIEERYFAAIAVREHDEFTPQYLEPYYRPDEAQMPFLLPQFSGFEPDPEIVWIPR